MQQIKRQSPPNSGRGKRNNMFTFGFYNETIDKKVINQTTTTLYSKKHLSKTIFLPHRFALLVRCFGLPQKRHLEHHFLKGKPASGKQVF